MSARMSRRKAKRQISIPPQRGAAKGANAQRQNVTAQGLTSYLSAFHDAYRDAVALVPNEFRHRLIRTAFLDLPVIAYVSTQNGVGFEYLEKGATVETTYRLGSRPVEQMLFGTPRQLIKHAGTGVGLNNAANATMESVSFRNINPIRLTGRHTSVRLIDVHCEAPNLGWTRNILYAELFGDRRSEAWTIERAVARAKDEVLLALVDVASAAKASVELGQYISTRKARQVLVLGDYSTEGRPRLAAIASEIAACGYDPILLDELPDEPSMDLSQKAVTVGSMSRFTVIDDSSKSGHLVEATLARTNGWITIVLRLEGGDSSYMTHGWTATSKVITELEYELGTLDATVLAGMQWAEKTREALVADYVSTYPWRAS